MEHLQTIKTPTLILQGERDTFGSRADVSGYKLSPAVRVSWLNDGDHSFKPRKTSGLTEQGNWDAAIGEIAEFLISLTGKRKAPKKQS